MIFEPYYKEPHSADGSCFIEKRFAKQWKVIWGHALQAIWPTRRLARRHIRGLKKGVPMAVVKAQYDPVARNWYLANFVIKKMGEAAFWAWSNDWTEEPGVGVELGPFKSLDEAEQGVLKHLGAHP